MAFTAVIGFIIGGLLMSVGILAWSQIANTMVCPPILVSGGTQVATEFGATSEIGSFGQIVRGTDGKTWDSTNGLQFIYDDSNWPTFNIYKLNVATNVATSLMNITDANFWYDIDYNSQTNELAIAFSDGASNQTLAWYNANTGAFIAEVTRTISQGEQYLTTAALDNKVYWQTSNSSGVYADEYNASTHTYVKTIKLTSATNALGNQFIDTTNHKWYLGFGAPGKIVEVNTSTDAATDHDVSGILRDVFEVSKIGNHFLVAASTVTTGIGRNYYYLDSNFGLVNTIPISATNGGGGLNIVIVVVDGTWVAYSSIQGVGDRVDLIDSSGTVLDTTQTNLQAGFRSLIAGDNEAYAIHDGTTITRLSISSTTQGTTTTTTDSHCEATFGSVKSTVWTVLTIAPFTLLFALFAWFGIPKLLGNFEW